MFALISELCLAGSSRVGDKKTECTVKMAEGVGLRRRQTGLGQLCDLLGLAVDYERVHGALYDAELAAMAYGKLSSRQALVKPAK